MSVSEMKTRIAELQEENEALTREREKDKLSLIEMTERIDLLERQLCDHDNLDSHGDTSKNIDVTILQNSYNIESMEDDLQQISKVSQWTEEMETMREVQEKIRLLVWDLDRQREDLKLEIQRHKEMIVALEEQNDLDNVKIDILTRTMREFIKEDPNRWMVPQNHAKKLSWFGFPFLSSSAVTPSPSVAPSDATLLSGSCCGTSVGNSTDEFHDGIEAKDVDASSHVVCAAESNKRNKGENFGIIGRQGESLLTFDEDIKGFGGIIPDKAAENNDLEDCSIGHVTSMETDQILDTVIFSLEDEESEVESLKRSLWPKGRSLWA